MFLAVQSFGVNAGGWSGQNLYPRRLGDVNGDGLDDVVGFGAVGFSVALANRSSANGFNTPPPRT